MCLGVALRGTCAVHTPDDMPRLRFQVGTVAHPESHACSVYPSGRMDRAGAVRARGARRALGTGCLSGLGLIIHAVGCTYTCPKVQVFNPLTIKKYR